MTMLQIDGPNQTGTSILVRAQEDRNARLGLPGINFTIHSGSDTVIYTLTHELVVDEEGKGIMELDPAITDPLVDGAVVYLHFNCLIDGLVAETVLGWHRMEGRAAISAWLESTGHKAPKEDHGHWDTIWIDPQKSGYAALSACLECQNMPQFSADIGDAWKLVHRLIRSGWMFNHYGMPPPPSRIKRPIPWVFSEYPWAACFYRVAGQPYSFAPTAPLAICLAALEYASHKVVAK